MIKVRSKDARAAIAEQKARKDKETFPRRRVIVIDKLWYAFLTFIGCRFGGNIVYLPIPEVSWLVMLDVKGSYRESKRPFDTMVEGYKNALKGLEVLNRDEAKHDARYEALKDYWTDIEERVALYWETWKNRPCTQDIAPSDESIPSETICNNIDIPLHDYEVSADMLGYYQPDCYKV